MFAQAAGGIGGTRFAVARIPVAPVSHQVGSHLFGCFQKPGVATDQVGDDRPGEADVDVGFPGPLGVIVDAAGRMGDGPVGVQ